MRGLAKQGGLQKTVYLVGVLHAQGTALKAGIAGELRQANGLAQGDPLRQGVGKEADPTVLGAVDAARMRIAKAVHTQPCQRVALVLHHAGFHLHHRKGSFVDADDITAAAVGLAQQGGQGARESGYARHNAGLHIVRHMRRPFGRATAKHSPGHGAADRLRAMVIGIRPVLAKPGQANLDGCALIVTGP